MALSFDQLSATTFKNYRKTFTDNILEKITLYSKLKAMGAIEKKKGGIKIVEPLMYGMNSTFQSYSGYDVLSTTPQDGLTAAEYSWKNLSTAVTISKEEEDQNAGESKIIDLLKSKIQQAEKTYTMKFNKMLFLDGSGNGGKDVTGLAKYIPLSGAGTVGGIDASTYTWWKNSNVDTTAIATFATNNLGQINMRKAYNKASREGDKPNLIICNRDTFEAYEGILTSIERINFNGSKLKGDIGFEELMFKGTPVMWDYYCGLNAAETATTNTMYFLNTNYLKLIIDSDTDFTMTKWREPVNQMAKTAFILFRGELVCNNRMRQNVINFTALT